MLVYNWKALKRGQKNVNHTAETDIGPSPHSERKGNEKESSDIVYTDSS